MKLESNSPLVRRAAVHAALGDPGRLRIVDILSTRDATPSELMSALAMASNLLAHHLTVLRDAGLVTSHRSQGDRRRQYLRLIENPLNLTRLTPTVAAPTRVVFVCTANSARSQLAESLWRRASEVPSISAGTHPADRIDPGAIAVAARHDLTLSGDRPRHVVDVIGQGDLVISVCDRAHEQPGLQHDLHWSVPDPVPAGTVAAFDTAYQEIEDRVHAFAPRLAS